MNSYTHIIISACMKHFAFFILAWFFATGCLKAEEVTFNFGDYTDKGNSSGELYIMEKADVSISDTKFYGTHQYVSFIGGGVITVTPSSNVTITKVVINAYDTNHNGFQSGGQYTPSVGIVTRNADNFAVVEWTGSSSSPFTISHSKSIHWVTIVVTYTKGNVVEPDATLHSASFSVNGVVDDKNTISVAEGSAITFPLLPTLSCVNFVGWTREEINAPQVSVPEFVDTNTEKMGSNDVTYYAVFATSHYGELEELNSDISFRDGDRIAAFVNPGDKYYGLYHGAMTDGFIDYFVLDHAPSVSDIACDSRRSWLLTSAGSRSWYLGDINDGYIYNEAGTDNVYLRHDNRTAFSIDWLYSYFSIKNGNRWFACRTGLHDENKYKFQGCGTKQVANGFGEFLLYRLAIYYDSYFTTIPSSSVNFVATDGVDYYATFSNDDAVAFPKTLADGRTLSVRTVKAENGYAGTMNIASSFNCEVDDKVVLPARTGALLVVKGASTAPMVSYDVFLGDVPGDTEALNESNMLIACPETGSCPTREGSNLYYKLAYGDNANKSDLGFWWGSDYGSSNFNVKGGGAVLCVPQTMASNLRGFTFDGGGTLTVIGCQADHDSDAEVYNLEGKRLTKAQHGVHIFKGRKSVR